MLDSRGPCLRCSVTGRWPARPTQRVSRGQVATQETLRPLADFIAPDAAQNWQAVNDGVMGGISDRRFRITEEQTLEFFGTLSPENNGGFASVRTKPAD